MDDFDLIDFGVSLENVELSSENEKLENVELSNENKSLENVEIWSESESLEKVKINVRAVVESSQDNLPLKYLEKDYQDLVRSPIPYKALGFESARDLISALGDTVVIVQRDTVDNEGLGNSYEEVLKPVYSEATEHLKNMVRDQTKSDKNRNIQSSRGGPVQRIQVGVTTHKPGSRTVYKNTTSRSYSSSSSSGFSSPTFETCAQVSQPPRRRTRQNRQRVQPRETKQTTGASESSAAQKPRPNRRRRPNKNQQQMQPKQTETKAAEPASFLDKYGTLLAVGGGMVASAALIGIGAAVSNSSKPTANQSNNKSSGTRRRKKRY